MKHIKLMFSWIFIFSLTLSFFSCVKDASIDNSEKVIFQKSEKKISPSIYDNHILKAVEIKKGHHSIQALLKSENVKLELDKLALDMDNAKKIQYDFTPIELIEIPFEKSTTKSLVIYTYRENQLIASAEMVSLGSGKQQFQLKNMSGDLIQTMDLTKDMRIVGFVSYNFLPWNTLTNGKDVRDKGFVTPNYIVEDPGDKTCPQKTATYSDCMTCSINECAASFPCNATCMVAPVACLAGFSLACLTSN